MKGYLCKNNLFIEKIYKTLTSWRNEAAETQEVQQKELQSPAPGVEQSQELACSQLYRKQLCREGRGSGQGIEYELAIHSCLKEIQWSTGLQQGQACQQFKTDDFSSLFSPGEKHL